MHARRRILEAPGTCGLEDWVVLSVSEFDMPLSYVCIRVAWRSNLGIVCVMKVPALAFGSVLIVMIADEKGERTAKTQTLKKRQCTYLCTRERLCG